MLPDYKSELSRRDPVLGSVIQNIEITRSKPDVTLFESLVKSVVFQQLSGKAAGTIYNRLAGVCEGQIHPESILNKDVETLRRAGLSASKTEYVRNIARFALDYGLEEDKLVQMGDEELITYLTQIKGVGRWTAEMLLMFHLMREDVLPLDDLVIRNRMKLLYKIDRLTRRKENLALLELAESWRPYRSIACLYLWKSDFTQYL